MEDQLLVEPGFGEMAVKLSEAQIDVPDQPPGVGVVVGKAAGEFPYFAEIVANGSGEQRLAIQRWSGCISITSKRNNNLSICL